VPEADDSAERVARDSTHERSDVNIRVIAGFAAALLVAAVIIHIGLYGLLAYYQRDGSARAPAPVTAPAEEPFPGPRLQVSPQADLAQMRKAEENALRSYGWIDKERQIARIPVARAMELIAQKGLPVRKAERK